MTRPMMHMEAADKESFTRLTYPSRPLPHSIQLIFKQYNYNEFIADPAGSRFENAFVNRKKATTEKETVIELPMPAQLADATSIGITANERSVAEVLISKTLSGIVDNPRAASNKIASALQGLGASAASLFGNSDAAQTKRKEFSDAVGINADAIGRALAEMGKGTIEALGISTASLGAMTGSVSNPQATLFFSGVDLRSFQFDFQMRPESAAEAQTIRKIANAIKRNTLPETQSMGPADSALADIGGAAATRAFLRYPAVCFINLLGVDESHFLKFKPCMVSSVNIDYAGEGLPTIAQGGVPASVKLTLALQEIEIQTAADYPDDDLGDGGAEE